MTKTCTLCGETHPAEAMHPKYRRCLPCHQEWDRKRARKGRAHRQSQVLRYLRDHPCIDCGETDPEVLQFDHRDDVTKTEAISRMVQKRHSWEVIRAEIAKCEVRCANCHARRTAATRGWYAGLALLFEEAA